MKTLDIANIYAERESAASMPLPVSMIEQFQADVDALTAANYRIVAALAAYFVKVEDIDGTISGKELRTVDIEAFQALEARVASVLSYLVRVKDAEVRALSDINVPLNP